MKAAIYRWERKRLPLFHGRVKRRRAKAIVFLAARHFKLARPAVIGGRWHGGGTYLKDGHGEYVGRPTIKLTFSRCYAGVIFHEFAHHLQFSETGSTKDNLKFLPYLIRVWKWALESGLATKIFTSRQVKQITCAVNQQQTRK